MMKKPIRWKMLLAGGLIAMLVASCLPYSYTYYQSTRKIKKDFNTSDSLYLIYPYGNAGVFGKNDRVLSLDTSLDKVMEEAADFYLVKRLLKKGNFATLNLDESQRDTLATRFYKMTEDFTHTKRKAYTLKLDLHKKGYAMICWMDCLIRDYPLYVTLGGYNKMEVRFATKCHLGIVELETGRIVYYKYYSHQYNGIFGSTNKCEDKDRFNEVLLENLDHVWSEVEVK
jgi:hypothetical protein